MGSVKLKTGVLLLRLCLLIMVFSMSVARLILLVYFTLMTRSMFLVSLAYDDSLVVDGFLKYLGF